MKILCIGLLIFNVCDVPDPPKPTTVICPPVVEWKTSDQMAAAASLNALPVGHPLRKMAAIAVKQRDIMRACQKAKR